MTFEDATQMQQDDCLGHARGDASEYTHYELVSCDQDHVGKVFRITHLTTLTPGKKPDAEADAQCAADAPPQRLDYPADTYVSHGLRSTGLWRKGTTWWSAASSVWTSPSCTEASSTPGPGELRPFG